MRASFIRSSFRTSLLALAACVPLCAIAQPVFTGIDGSSHTSAQVDEAVSRAMQEAQVPGLALALIQGGKVTYLKAYGVRNLSPRQPLTANSAMYTASLGKVVTAYLTMKLVDDHVIDLDKPIYGYLPQPLSGYPDWRDVADDPRSKLITTRMLLSHTTGFNNWRYFDPGHRLTIHFQPGTQYSYCGECYDLLQLVLETVTKTPVEQLTQERVFRPLGMTRSSMVWQSAWEGDHANGYDEYGRLLGNEKRMTADAAGSMETTVTDYAKFTQAMLSGRGLSKESHAQMLSVQIPIVSKVEFPTFSPGTTDQYKGIQLSYGLGVGLYRTPHGWAFFKEGHDEGWRAYVVCHEDQATCMVVMTNSSNGESLYSALLKGILGDTWNPIDWEGFTPYDKLPPRKALTDHTAVDLGSWFATYAGRYGAGGHMLAVAAEGDHLSVVGEGKPKRDFFPETGSIFFTKDSDETLTFLFDIRTYAFRVLREAGGEDEVLPNFDWTRCRHGLCAAQRASAGGP